MKYHQIKTLCLFSTLIMGCSPVTSAPPTMETDPSGSWDAKAGGNTGEKGTSNTCIPVGKTRDQLHGYFEVASSINKSGHYCLVENIHTRPLRAMAEGFREMGGASHTLLIGVSDVSLDMQGHEIYAEATDTRGIANPVESEVSFNRAKEENPKRITISNGSIRAKGAIAVELSGVEREQLATTSVQYILKNLKLQVAKGTLLDLWGGDSKVIGSILVSDNVGGDYGVSLKGPRQIIEGNTIKLHYKKTKDRAQPAIFLDTADNSIIRNNTFILESDGGELPEAAIELYASKNVLIENNKIIGASKAVFIDKDPRWPASTGVIERGNTFEKSPFDSLSSGIKRIFSGW